METTQKHITGRHVFVALVLFFGIIIAVNTTLAVLASASWTGLVVENGYVASQNFNRDLAEARRQAGFGWAEELSFSNGLLQVKLKDREGRPLSRFAVSVKLERPSSDREDRHLTLFETMGGAYAMPIALKTGQWDADVTVESPMGEAMRRIHRFYVSDRG